LVIDRDDGVINLLEMKYSSEPYVLTAATARETLRKVELFTQSVETKKQILPVLVSPFGLKPGPWNEEVFPGGVVQLESLF